MERYKEFYGKIDMADRILSITTSDRSAKRVRSDGERSGTIVEEVRYSANIPVSAVLLAANSSWLRERLSSLSLEGRSIGSREFSVDSVNESLPSSRELNRPIVTIEVQTPEEVKEVERIVKFIYTGDIEQEHRFDSIELGDRYGCISLMELGCKSVSNSISATNSIRECKTLIEQINGIWRRCSLTQSSSDLREMVHGLSDDRSTLPISRYIALNDICKEALAKLTSLIGNSTVALTQLHLFIELQFDIVRYWFDTVREIDTLPIHTIDRFRLSFKIIELRQRELSKDQIVTFLSQVTGPDHKDVTSASVTPRFGPIGHRFHGEPYSLGCSPLRG